jgi:hypothetical protein
LVILAGCSGGQRTAVPVSGSVTYNGQPVAGATVIFLGKANEPAATGITATDGTFRLSTYGEADGAVPGQYSVTVVKMEGGPADDPNAPFDPVADMEAAAKNTAPAPPAHHLLPEKYATAKESPLGFTVGASGSNQFPIELKD